MQRHNEDEVIEQAVDEAEFEKNMRHLSQWKLTRWKKEYDATVSKDAGPSLVCRICEKSFAVDHLKHHSGVCRRNHELMYELGQVNAKLLSAIFDVIWIRRDLVVRLLVLRYAVPTGAR
jgi:uncharacterized Fe-S radical SAM superfamily protein PflX